MVYFQEQIGEDDGDNDDEREESGKGWGWCTDDRDEYNIKKKGAET